MAHSDTRSIQRFVPILCCESRTKFSAQASGGEQDGGFSAEIPDRLHVHSNSGREQNSAMHYICGCARNGGYEDWTKEILRHFEAYGFLNPVVLQCDKEKSYHRCVKKSCTRTKRENSVKICAKNKSSEQRVCRSSARTHSGTRTMLPDTN